jgi:molybdate transport system permease protein
VGIFSKKFLGQSTGGRFGLLTIGTSAGGDGLLSAGLTWSLPLVVRAVRVAIDAVDRKLEDAARILRASEWSIFLKITLPLATHGLVAGAVLGFARALGEFGATIVFAGNFVGKTQTIPLGIFTFLNQPDGTGKAKILVAVSVVFAYASVLVNEWLLQKFKRGLPQANHSV